MAERTLRILITGGAGFIGTHLVAKLASLGEVFVFDSFHPQVHDDPRAARNALERQGVRVLTGDVRDEAALGAAVREAMPDTVFHLAAETGTGQSFELPRRYVDVNVGGTVRLIEAIRTHAPCVDRVILAGSRAVYGEGAYVDEQGRPARPVPRLEADMLAGDYSVKDARGAALFPAATNADWAPAPASIYASTKLMQEYLLQQAFWGSATRVGIVRLQNVFGPGQSLHNSYTGVLCHFCNMLRNRRPVELFEDGAIERDFVFVGDVVDALVRLATMECMPCRIIDIGSGRATTIAEAASILCRLFGLSNDLIRVTAQFRPGDVRRAVADVSLARSLLGWEPKHGLEEGLALLVNWVAELSPAEMA